ncbi:MAG TPA: hypothetical protein VMZ49_08420 [Patescibacteria group bacterium]|nr:hypothetical protein [Patescibacteria group bacterium]
MSDWQEILRQGFDQAEPGPDFEETVFSKIKKKKKQRKIGFTIMAVVGLFMLLSLFQLFRPAPRGSAIPGLETDKEEIPLHEDLFFSASDSRTRYTLEPVSYQKKTGSQDAALNQI